MLDVKHLSFHVPIFLSVYLEGSSCAAGSVSCSGWKLSILSPRSSGWRSTPQPCFTNYHWQHVLSCDTGCSSAGKARALTINPAVKLVQNPPRFVFGYSLLLKENLYSLRRKEYYTNHNYPFLSLHEVVCNLIWTLIMTIFALNLALK